jgi:hypothetical protein
MSHHQYPYGNPYQPGSVAGPAGSTQTQGQPQGPSPQMSGWQQPSWPNPYGYPSAYPAVRAPSVLPSDRFMKGLLIGAAATYLLTNEQVQRTAIKGLVKAWSLLQGGIEEIKERFGDAEAELRHTDRSQNS